MKKIIFIFVVFVLISVISPIILIVQITEFTNFMDLGVRNYLLQSCFGWSIVLVAAGIICTIIIKNINNKE